jgi:hypothetical protein
MLLDSKKIKVITTIGMIVFMAFAVALPVFAAANNAAPVDPFGVSAVGGNTGLGNNDIRDTIGSIIKVALGFLGVVAIVIVLIGGFKYMTAGGSDEKVQDARKYIVSGIIGLAIILSAYAITSFVVTGLMNATGSGTP